MPAEMGWGRPYHFPRAIIHVDGDSFFAACEVAKNPALKGKPVVTGKERGIISAATYEAKALGVTRGTSIAEARRICPELIVIDSDYETYGLYSRRMYAIMRRYTPIVEEYGIDECFGELTGLKRKLKMSYEEIAQAIQADLTRELNITFGVGLAPNKVLAKVGSKYRKPNGFTSIPLTERERYLADTAIGAIWGIGPNTARFLNTHGVRTALDFAKKSNAWVKETVTAPIYEIWRELNGEMVMELVTEAKESYQSIQRTRTFRPATHDPEFLMAQLSKNLEGACAKARRFELSARRVSFFLKSQSSFRYRVCDLTLERPTNVPSDILSVMETHLASLIRQGETYRATGVTLAELTERAERQPDLFSDPAKLAGKARVYEKVDELAQKYGKNTVYLASSMRAIAEDRADEEHHHEYGTSASFAENAPQRFSGAHMKKLFSMPYLGEVG
ncbi:MAG: nucleotidyltransferase/DNA polymerase protein [Parcubacteria group bacterium]|nr:nucleotidyltransferase/DNA polymerase protein [Parcubacteria group bacterium]